MAFPEQPWIPHQSVGSRHDKEKTVYRLMIIMGIPVSVKTAFILKQVPGSIPSGWQGIPARQYNHNLSPGRTPAVTFCCMAVPCTHYVSTRFLYSWLRPALDLPMTLTISVGLILAWEMGAARTPTRTMTFSGWRLRVAVRYIVPDGYLYHMPASGGGQSITHRDQMWPHSHQLSARGPEAGMAAIFRAVCALAL